MALIRNDFEQAIKNLEESNQKSPNNPEVLRNLGWAYTMMGDVKKWVILLERALTIAPDDILIMEDLGVALLTQGKIKEAREYLSRVGKESHMSDMWFPV
jgi:Flp pilus assembly protein TadD